MSFWTTINGSVMFRHPYCGTDVGIKNYLLRFSGSKKVLSGSEGAVTLSFVREKLSRTSRGSDDNFFKHTSDYKEDEVIKGFSFQENLRDWDMDLEEALKILGETFVYLDEQEGISSAIVHISSDLEGDGIGYFDIEQRCFEILKK